MTSRSWNPISDANAGVVGVVVQVITGFVYYGVLLGLQPAILTCRSVADMADCSSEFMLDACICIL